MGSLKLKKVGVSWNRFFGVMMAIGSLMFAGASILGLRDALQRGEIAWVIILSLFLLVFFGTLVLALVVVISDHTFDEVLDEDLVRWWRKKGANIAKSGGRRILYLLGALACGSVDYLIWVASKIPMEGDRSTIRLLISLFCIVVPIAFATVTIIVMLALAVLDPPLAEVVMLGWPRKKEG